MALYRRVRVIVVVWMRVRNFNSVDQMGMKIDSDRGKIPAEQHDQQEAEYTCEISVG